MAYIFTPNVLQELRDDTVDPNCLPQVQVLNIEPFSESSSAVRLWDGRSELEVLFVESAFNQVQENQVKKWSIIRIDQVARIRRLNEPTAVLGVQRVEVLIPEQEISAKIIVNEFTGAMDGPFPIKFVEKFYSDNDSAYIEEDMMHSDDMGQSSSEDEPLNEQVSLEKTDADYLAEKDELEKSQNVYATDLLKVVDKIVLSSLRSLVRANLYSKKIVARVDLVDLVNPSDNFVFTIRNEKEKLSMHCIVFPPFADKARVQIQPGKIVEITNVMIQHVVPNHSLLCSHNLEIIVSPFTKATLKIIQKKPSRVESKKRARISNTENDDLPEEAAKTESTKRARISDTENDILPEEAAKTDSTKRAKISCTENEILPEETAKADSTKQPTFMDSTVGILSGEETAGAEDMVQLELDDTEIAILSGEEAAGVKNMVQSEFNDTEFTILSGEEAAGVEDMEQSEPIDTKVGILSGEEAVGVEDMEQSEPIDTKVGILPSKKLTRAKSMVEPEVIDPDCEILSEKYARIENTVKTELIDTKVGILPVESARTEDTKQIVRVKKEPRPVVDAEQPGDDVQLFYLNYKAQCTLESLQLAKGVGFCPEIILEVSQLYGFYNYVKSQELLAMVLQDGTREIRFTGFSIQAKYLESLLMNGDRLLIKYAKELNEPRHELRFESYTVVKILPLPEPQYNPEPIDLDNIKEPKRLDGIDLKIVRGSKREIKSWDESSQEYYLRCEVTDGKKKIVGIFNIEDMELLNTSKFDDVLRVQNALIQTNDDKVPEKSVDNLILVALNATVTKINGNGFETSEKHNSRLIQKKMRRMSYEYTSFRDVNTQVCKKGAVVNIVGVVTKIGSCRVKKLPSGYVRTRKLEFMDATGETTDVSFWKEVAGISSSLRCGDVVEITDGNITTYLNNFEVSVNRVSSIWVNPDIPEANTIRARFAELHNKNSH